MDWRNQARASAALFVGLLPKTYAYCPARLFLASECGVGDFVSMAINRDACFCLELTKNPGGRNAPGGLPTFADVSNIDHFLEVQPCIMWCSKPRNLISPDRIFFGLA
jgi:hypothetical protein